MLKKSYIIFLRKLKDSPEQTYIGGQPTLTWVILPGATFILVIYHYCKNVHHVSVLWYCGAVPVQTLRSCSLTAGKWRKGMFIQNASKETTVIHMLSASCRCAVCLFIQRLLILNVLCVRLAPNLIEHSKGYPEIPPSIIKYMEWRDLEICK